ncbi:MAG: metallophosphoesterase [Chloroflexota bacterium]
MNPPTYFIHISDTHIGPTKGYKRHGFASYPCAERMVDIINAFPQKPDFVIHTGDVVTDPDDQSYKLAAELFEQLSVPIYFVNGNHDSASDIRKFLKMGPKHDLMDDELVYRFEVKGNHFLVIDGRADDELDPHGMVSEAQLEVLRQECTPDGPPLTIFLHYPLWPINSTWFDTHMLVINAAELHDIFLQARNRLRGVFHGHIHQAMQTIKDGIVYTSAPSTFAQFAAWPGATEPAFVKDPPGYGFVHLVNDQVIVHQHTFERTFRSAGKSQPIPRAIAFREPTQSSVQVRVSER